MERIGDRLGAPKIHCNRGPKGRHCICRWRQPPDSPPSPLSLRPLSPFAQRLGERARERGYPKLGRVIPPNYRSQTAIYRFDEIKAISDFR